MRHFSGSAPRSPPSATLPPARLAARLAATAAPAPKTPTQKPRKAASSPATISPASSMTGPSKVISGSLAAKTAPEADQHPARTNQSQSAPMAASGRPISGATAQRRVRALSTSKGSASAAINAVKSMDKAPIRGIDFNAPARCNSAVAAPAIQASASRRGASCVSSDCTLNPPAWQGGV